MCQVVFPIHFYIGSRACDSLSLDINVVFDNRKENALFSFVVFFVDILGNGNEELTTLFKKCQHLCRHINLESKELIV